jgi:hypothetical protein
MHACVLRVIPFGPLVAALAKVLGPIHSTCNTDYDDEYGKE